MDEIMIHGASKSGNTAGRMTAHGKGKGCRPDLHFVQGKKARRYKGNRKGKGKSQKPKAKGGAAEDGLRRR